MSANGYLFLRAVTKEVNIPSQSACAKFDSLKPLPLLFTGKGEVRGFQFSQIHVSDRAYCYEVNVGGVLYYHTFKRIENRRYLTIAYPGPKAFGLWAWVYRSLDEAQQKFQELTMKGGKGNG